MSIVYIKDLHIKYNYGFPDASQVRLVDGKSVYENGVDVYQGRLEVFYNQEWGNVCDDNFNQTSARVVCRMLGFEGLVSIPSLSFISYTSILDRNVF